MKRLALIAFLFVSGLSAAQSVPYTKFTLDNGMTFILHEDHSVPKIAVNTWFHVGSKDEPDRRSGFAHLFEHLMFMGTFRAPGHSYDDWMEAEGGSNNASTTQDRTNYFGFGPSSELPLLLWLEADRMEHLGKAMTKQKVDLQRQVVLNERREWENSPYGNSEIKMDELLYPVGHPYHFSTIGLPEDLNSATVSDVKTFFATYYVPNNATMVIAGDFDSKKIRPMIDQYFGTLPRGNDPIHKSAPQPENPSGPLSVDPKVFLHPNAMPVGEVSRSGGISRKAAKDRKDAKDGAKPENRSLFAPPPNSSSVASSFGFIDLVWSCWARN